MPHYTLTLSGRETLAAAFALLAIGGTLGWVFHC